MKNSCSKILKFVKVCYRVVRRCFKAYSSKYSKRVYTQHQHMCIVCLMKRLKMHYRDIIDMLHEMHGIREFLKMDKIPHFTTIQKFVQRTNFLVLEKLLNETALLFPLSDMVGIDASGYTQRHASRCYTDRIEARKTYIKDSICIDAKNQCIVTSVQSEGHKHDTNFYPLLLSRTSRINKVSNCVADKGYDSTKNREFSKILKIKSIIPYREYDEVLAIMNRHIDKIYHQRSKVETVFSVIKRKFDDTVHSIKFSNQKKEVKVLDIVYNLYRFVKIFYFFIRGFLRSQITIRMQ